MALLTKEVGGVSEDKVRLRYGNNRQGIYVRTFHPVEPQHPDVILIPGYVGNGHEPVSRRVARSFAQQGRTTHIVTFYGHFHGRRLDEAAHARQLTPRGHGTLEVNRSPYVLDFIDDQNLTPSLVPHSNGTQTAMHTAAVAGDRIRALAIMAGTGRNDQVPIRFLASRFLMQTVPELLIDLFKADARAPAGHLLVGTGKALAMHPVQTLFTERRSIKHANLSVVADSLSSLMGIVEFVGKKDWVFGPKQNSHQTIIYNGRHADFLSGRLTPAVHEQLMALELARSAKTI